MKIAFATEDLERVDAHFGWARNIMVYDLTEEGHTHVDTFTFGGELREDGNESKLQPKIEAIHDCAIVYVADIGGPAAARIVAKKIHPIKAKTPESIESILNRIGTVMKGTPPPWLRKAMMKGQERPAFDEED